MCYHPEQFQVLTREERLMETEAVRAHHQRLAREANRSRAGEEAYEAHAREHREAAQRLRAERTK